MARYFPSIDLIHELLNQLSTIQLNQEDELVEILDMNEVEVSMQCIRLYIQEGERRELLRELECFEELLTSVPDDVKSDIISALLRTLVSHI